LVFKLFLPAKPNPMIRKALLIFSLFAAVLCMKAQDKQDSLSQEEIDELMAGMQLQVDSVEKSFHYQTGEIDLGGGIGKLVVPEGFEYLDPIQAKRVMEELWGNPPQETYGMLVPKDGGVLQDHSWAFDIYFDAIGYVEDDDAEDMDYEEVLTGLKKEISDANAQLVQQNFASRELIGWASPPYYDKDKKILHWAQELKFQDMDVNTINYNVRILGRKGVMVVNAIGAMPQLEEIKASIPQIAGAVTFTEGNKYENFDSSVDEVAAYTIGGLVAGKILAKVGIFAVLAKFGKFIIVGLIAGGAGIWRWITGRKKRDEAIPTDMKG
jgi:uncharacterized membrane-anchored protein